MKSRVLACSLLLAGGLAAHGGVYRGPGSVLPLGRNAPGVVGDDLTQWQFWWEFRKDKFLAEALRRRGRVPPALPEETITETIVPALVAALEDRTTNRDVRSACLLALAKAGARKELLTRARAMSMSSTPEVRESAILALGVAGITDAVPELLEIAMDTEKARRDRDAKGPIDDRLRAFACYALGLLGHNSTDSASKRSIFLRLRWILTEQKDVAPKVQAAAVDAIRILRPDVDTKAGQRLRQLAVGCMTDIVQQEERTPLVRAHAWTGLGVLAERGDEAVLALLREALEAPSSHWVRGSLVLAMGRVATAKDTKACATLRNEFLKGQDQQARHFAAIALGRIGGTVNRSWLRQQLVSRRRPGSSLYRPWLALALVLSAVDPSVKPSERKAITRTIRKQGKETKNPILVAGLGLASALLGDKAAIDLLRERFDRHQRADEPAGYFALALALLGDDGVSRRVRKLVAEGRRRPMLLTHCYPVLGIFGGEESRKALLDCLMQRGTVGMFAGAARGLGLLRDPESVPPLVELLKNPHRQPLLRAFAAVALGELCRTELEPWSTPLLDGFNYRASFETHSSWAKNGILDLL